MPIDDHKIGTGEVGNTRPEAYRSEDSPGYETTDVNVGGVIVFLAGLSGFLLIFFVFCFVMGKVINNAFLKEDGPIDKWHLSSTAPSAYPNPGGKITPVDRKREDLTSNPVMEQRELQRMTNSFPSPRLQMDDGNQDVADLHAREDLLLENYSSDDGTTRIPIERAMELVVQRGLPVVQAPQAAGPQMAGETAEGVTRPLTNGFARTGYELDVMEARAEKLSYGKAEGGAQAELKPAR